jgi:hypothetical protein
VSLRSALRELLSDDDGLLSTGRLISLVGAFLGLECVQVGIGLSIFVPASSAGLGLCGIGAGFFTGGALLKFGSKSQEARFQPQFSGQAPLDLRSTSGGVPGQSSGAAHI